MLTCLKIPVQWEGLASDDATVWFWLCTIAPIVSKKMD